MASIRVEVVFAAAAAADRVVLELPEGSGAGEAARLSGLAARHGLDAGAMILGIAGRKIPADHALAEGDRVEILRPLLADPKEARRRRARTFRGRRGG